VAAWLVTGLGNPGPDYSDNRHNIGFMVIDELCTRWNIPLGSLKGKFGSEVAQADRLGQRVHLQKPMEFMNVSGMAVQRVSAFFRIDVRETLIVHDDIDLPFGRVKVKIGGGHGGHNGLRSISEAIGPAYLRVRCGVGKPAGGKERVVGHVLSPFSKAEKKELPFLIGAAADAVEAILEKGATFAMNKYNADKEPAP
jgi:PTH1 family peptidyl-tRNA hydrolase